ncbi:MAG: TetR/AcrR family transcriptional regulator [Flavobacteriaceae bacterium]
MGKRASQKIEIRNRLLEVGKTLFSAKGLDAVTVAEVVEQAQIARGTFYNYFDDCSDLFQAIVLELIGQIREVFNQNRTSKTSLHTYLYTTFKSYFDFISTEEMADFHLKNQAHIRQSSYQNDILKSIMKDLNRDLKASERIGDFDEKYEFLLLSFMLVGSPLELFIATRNSNLAFSSDQLALFLAKLFHKVLKK